MEAGITGHAESVRVVYDPKRIGSIQPASAFWPAEPVHQHYYKTHAAAYQMYRIGCGRDARLAEL